ncbi:HalOD1 output domain-containing protein [Halalkalicoccus jeotgali]|nr:HalOD1 output domain-containing protein [Halalkalicoccus jeotgali]ELY34215.1 hypothetical protein C497_17587 [Halalkalicoccus jeotgali B3]
MSTSSLDETSTVSTVRPDRHEEFTTAIIEAIAAAEDTDPMDLDVRISEVVDPDALNTLFASTSDRSGQFTFELAGYLICLSATGEITLYTV